MNDYKVCIPSYNRLDILLSKTLPLLIRRHINKENIYIFVVEEEYNKYKEALPNLNIIIGEKGCVNQRNFIRKYFNEGDYIISLDDDIENIQYISFNEFYDIDNLEDFFKYNYEFMKDINVNIWGIYPVYNKLFMDKQKEHISTGLNFLIGHLYGFINRKDSYYDLDCNVMHDYENSLKHYLKDGRIIRLNNVACKTKMYAKGGIGNKNDRYEDMENDVMFLMSKYPDMVVPKKKRDGMPHITLKKLPPIFFDL